MAKADLVPKYDSWNREFTWVKSASTRSHSAHTLCYEQLDLIMTNKRWKNSIIDVEAKHDSGINSDHVPVVARARVRLSAKKKGAQQRERLEYNKNQEEKERYNAQLKEKLEGKRAGKNGRKE